MDLLKTINSHFLTEHRGKRPNPDIFKPKNHARASKGNTEQKKKEKRKKRMAALLTFRMATLDIVNDNN